MHVRGLLFIFCLWFISAPAFSQADAARNATASEIEGYWQLIPLPPKLQPNFLSTNPWPAQCQWFYYASDGQMKSIDKLHGPCELNSRQQLAEVFRDTPPVISWRYSFSVPNQKGVLVISRSDVKGYGELWEPQIVTKPFVNGGVEFQVGDLILYLADLQNRKITWIRHLRKVG